MEIKKKYKAAFETFKLPNVLKLLEMRVRKELPRSKKRNLRIAARSKRGPVQDIRLIVLIQPEVHPAKIISI